MKKLIDGYQQLRKKYYEEQPALFQKLKQGQEPGFIFLGCADSRVDPAIITQSEPGNLFVLRNIANFVPPYRDDRRESQIAAGIELAVNKLHINHVIIMGHEKCAGVELMAKHAAEKCVGRVPHVWEGEYEALKNAIVGEYGEDTSADYERANIEIAVGNLKTYPSLEPLIESGDLKITGWYFRLTDGSIDVYEKGQWRTGLE